MTTPSGALASINAPHSVASFAARNIGADRVCRGHRLPHYRQDQRDAFARVLQNTRSIQLVQDREMQADSARR